MLLRAQYQNQKKKELEYEKYKNDARTAVIGLEKVLAIS